MRGSGQGVGTSVEGLVARGEEVDPDVPQIRIAVVLEEEGTSVGVALL